MKKKLLYCFYTSNFEDIEKKGVIDEYNEFLEGDFFDRVIFICPVARISKKITLSPKINIYQVGWKLEKYPKLIQNIFKYPYYFLRLLSFLYFLIFQIKKYKKNSSIILRTTDPFYVGLICLIVSKITALPFVLSVHSNYDLTDKAFKRKNKLKIFFRNIIRSQIYKRAFLIIAIRENIAQGIKSLNSNLCGKVKTIYHGVNCNDLSKGRIYPIHNNSVNFSYVGRLSPENFPLDIIDLCAALRSNGVKSFKFYIAGDGPLKQEMQKKVEKNNLQDHIKFLGFIDRLAVFKLRSETISFIPMGGMSLLEAMSAKSVVIAYNVDWHHEAIDDGINGFLIGFKDYYRFAKIISNLKQNPKKLETISESAYLKINNKFTREKSRNKKIEVYEQVFQSV